MIYKGIKYYSYDELKTIAKNGLLKNEDKNTNKRFNKAQIGEYLAKIGYLKRRIQINGLRKQYYFKSLNKY